MGLLNKPVVRDTTANSSAEILRRLTFAGYVLSILLVPVLGVAAAAQRDSFLLGWTIACATAGGVLHLTRRFWKTSARPEVREADKPAPDTADPTTATAGRRPRIVVLNAALAGDSGNTAILLARAGELLAPAADVSAVTLTDGPVFSDLRQTLAGADAFVIGTGTHWDSWSSTLQRFLEDATEAEGTAVWLGKPAACVVTEHSVGGKSVLSRLQGVLVTLGCTLPPMSGLVLSRAAHVAARHDTAAARDFWCGDDLDVVCHNLLEALHGTRHWRTWPVDRSDFRARWLES